MQQFYDTITEFERDGFHIIVDKTWEGLHPSDTFDESCWDINELCEDIDAGRLDWFMLRVRVLADNVVLATEVLGGCLYKNAEEVLTDGVVEDLLSEAIPQAKAEAQRLTQLFQTLILD